MNSVIIFLSQMTLIRWLTFLLGSLIFILTVLLFWTYFFLLTLVFVLQWLSLHWEILIMLLSQFTLTFRQTKLNGSAAASEFCEWFQVGIDVHIHLHKYQVKPHSSSWFSAAFTAAIVDRNHFFRLYQQSKSFESKVKFR